MACNSSACKSGCYRDKDADAAEPRRRDDDSRGGKNGGRNDRQSLCLKCKENKPMSDAEDGRFCGVCFSSNLYGKFKHAVSSSAMITPSDNVLVAFSGGPSSRVALQFVHEMQHRAQKNYDASKDRSLPVFGVGVAFIDESDIFSVPSPDAEKAIEDIKLIVSNLEPPEKELHIVPIEKICSSDISEGKGRLRRLLDAVNDATGKEDLLMHLRMLLLQKVASENRYNRLVLGSCTSRIACHVLSATVKGQGYSLSADVQYVDTRWDVPVVLPLRDCPSQELNMLCHLDGLKIVELHKSPCSSINSLVSSFVKLLQEENPSRECTIVRTAGKLTPFHFNRIPEISDASVPLATRRRQKRLSLKPNLSLSSELLCSICGSPIDKSNSPQRNIENGQDPFVSGCCSSCQFQILPKDPSLMENFVSLLPQQLISRAKCGHHGDVSLLREQIQEFLLSDGEDES